MTQQVVTPLAAMKQAVEHMACLTPQGRKAYFGLVRAIAELEKQEPVRIMGFNCVCGRRMEVSAEQGVVPAPQRQWIGLTDEETAECFEAKSISDRLKADAKRIEAKLKEKNT